MRKIGVGFRCFEIGLGLYQLLIDFGRINIGEKFCLANAGADIAVPLFEVTVGPRINRRFDVSLHGAGEH